MKREDRLLYLMSRAQHRLREYTNASLKAGGAGVSHAQAGILFLLTEKSPLSMSELSRRFDVDNSAITGMVDRIEKAGLVTKGAHLTDRRVNLIAITDDGAREATRCAKIINRINREIKDGFAAGEVDAFARVLESMFEKFQTEKGGTA